MRRNLLLLIAFMICWTLTSREVTPAARGEIRTLSPGETLCVNTSGTFLDSLTLDSLLTTAEEFRYKFRVCSIDLERQRELCDESIAFRDTLWQMRLDAVVEQHPWFSNAYFVYMWGVVSTIGIFFVASRF